MLYIRAGSFFIRLQDAKNAYYKFPRHPKLQGFLIIKDYNPCLSKILVAGKPTATPELVPCSYTQLSGISG